jgi:hypothetical protein
MRRIGIIVLLFFSAAAAADAQESDRFSLLTGAQYGSPARAAADLGIMFTTKESKGWRCGFLAEGAEIVLGRMTGLQSTDMQCGFLVEGGLGQGGARYSAGVMALDNTSIVDGGGWGIDARVVMNHTFASPRRATPDSKYVGVEAGLTIMNIFRLSAGVSHRVAGPSGPHGTIFMWDGGVQIRVPLLKIR